MKYYTAYVENVSGLLLVKANNKSDAQVLVKAELIKRCSKSKRINKIEKIEVING